MSLYKFLLLSTLTCCAVQLTQLLLELALHAARDLFHVGLHVFREAAPPRRDRASPEGGVAYDGSRADAGETKQARQVGGTRQKCQDSPAKRQEFDRAVMAAARPMLLL